MTSLWWTSWETRSAVLAQPLAPLTISRSLSEGHQLRWIWSLWNWRQRSIMIRMYLGWLICVDSRESCVQSWFNLLQPTYERKWAWSCVPRCWNGGEGAEDDAGDGHRSAIWVKIDNRTLSIGWHYMFLFDLLNFFAKEEKKKQAVLTRNSCYRFRVKKRSYRLLLN